ncbi:signal transducer and activator of transcription 5B-like [Bradysia coprophila]|uniref:signal transducer and activator of transcription 5B-like n=1 Tax=Bradysia coprophila TaxID=38358 RepID=UPI00187D79B9|nr:signal transducer and activator of transcription 5B-like [Bradysia coprophila]
MKEESFVDIDDPQIELNASQFLHALIQEVQNEKQKLNRVEQLSIKCRLDESIQTFTQQLYCPFVIYKHIRDTISYEQNLIENVCGGQQTIDPEAADINNKLKELTIQMQINKGKQTEYRHEVENCKLLNCSDKIRQKQRFLVDRATNLYQSFESTIDKIDAVQVVIVNRLGKWKRDQALAGNGAPLNGDTLDEIQRWFEALGKVILNTRLCIDATHELNVGLPMAMNMEDVMRKITALLQNLIVSGFIVEKQPPQVMKRNVRFSATVRLLTADFHKSNPSVVVSILSGKSKCIWM